MSSILLSLVALAQPAVAQSMPDPELIADTVGMELLAYREFDVTDEELGIDLRVGSITMRDGLRTEAVYFAAEQYCSASEVGCLAGFPALARTKHVGSADGLSVTRTVSARDSLDPASWSWLEGLAVEESLSVTATEATMDSLWYINDELVIESVSTSSINDLRAVAEDDKLAGMLPFATGDGALQGYVPYSSATTSNTSSWDAPDMPDGYFATEKDCYEAVGEELAKEKAYLDDLWTQLNAVTKLAWLDPLEYMPQFPLGGGTTLIKSLLLADIQATDARVREMEEWLSDCLSTVPDDPDPTPTIPLLPPTFPDILDFENLELCMICTVLLPAGGQTSVWTEEPDPDNLGETIATLNIITSTENLCFEWSMGYGHDTDGDMFCDQSLDSP